MTCAPFIILALPRSRTFWLSRFLSYNGFECGHEQVRHFRSPDDIKAWLSMPGWGTAETAAAPFWRTLHRLAPQTRVVVVRRPADEVLASMNRLGIAFDAAALAAVIRGLDAKLDQIARRWPPFEGVGCLSVRFTDLEDEATCAAVFEHCLPFRHDPAWWRTLAAMNLQCNMPALMRYYAAYKPALDKLAATVKHQTVAAMRPELVEADDGVTLQQEPFETFLRDGTHLFAEHLVRVGEAPGAYDEKNIPLMRRLEQVSALQITTARCNGRMFGYLMTIVGPSLGSPDIISATNTTFFASPAIRGLGMKLQRASIEALRARGVDEVFMVAGARGDGPRMGGLYRRLGGEINGQWFRLNLKEA